jgi:hypothetical protein
MEKVFDVPKKLVRPKKRGGGGEIAEISGAVGHNPKKSGKFLSAPLIFSFPYAHEYI